MYATPVPAAPSASTLSAADHGSVAGGEVTSPLITASCAVAQISCPAARVTGARPDGEMNRRENGKPRPYEQAAARHIASPVRVFPLSPGAAPSRTTAPTNPTASPATLRRSGRSDGISHVVAGSASSGVIAFHRPAETEVIRCSP